MQNLAPRITIVIPNYNSGKIIRRCIKSIISQQYENLELILADGGSDDESIKICKKYRELFAVFNSEQDEGISDALNKGFQHATGEIYAWLAADDELAPGALNKVSQIFTEKQDIDVLTGGCKRYFPDGSTVITIPPEDLTERILFQNVIEQPSTFWRSSLHHKNGKIDTSLQLAFDWDLWCRFNELGARFKIVDDILSHYHFSDDNLTSKSGEKIMQEMFRVVSRYGPYYGLTAYVYKFLFYTFDLRGCYDKPPESSKVRQAVFYSVLSFLYALFGRKIINGYNWTFVSRQMRNKKWYS